MVKMFDTLDILTPTERTLEQEARLEETLSHLDDTRRVVGQLAMILHTELGLPEPDQQ